MKTKKILLSAAISAMTLTAGQASAGLLEDFSEALSTGKAYGDFRLRYESVDQPDLEKDAEALTLRSRLGYTTGSMSGFSATAEFEDSRTVLDVDGFFVKPTGFGDSGDSVIADAPTTELDQAFIQYKSDSVTTKLGRQVITLDGHRHVGHVGWRQDRQTFDGLTVKYSTGDFTGTFAYLDKRNRIFAEAADVDSTDILLNGSYKLGSGKLVGYAYLLEDDATESGADTYGVSYSGKASGFKYSAEFATQETDSDFSATYLNLSGAFKTGPVNVKLGYEILGSDDGNYGFSTPLATLHKFNGWADTFLGTPAGGLEDLSIAVSGKLLGGKAAFVYHDYYSNETTEDLGDEINLVYKKKFAKSYNAGIKYAMYSAGDASTEKTDTDKLWLWVGTKF